MTLYDSLSQDTAAAAESLSAMMQKEQMIYKCSDYLHTSMTEEAIIITESDRLKIVDWLYSIVDRCNFNRETVAIAMEMVDRFLSRPTSTTRAILHHDHTRTQFQLLAMAALYIAIKTNETFVVLGSHFFAAMSQGVHSAQDIEDMELTILKGLSWRVCAPTSIQISHLILSLILPHVTLKESATWGMIFDKVKYQTEHAVRYYYFTSQRQSTVALVAIFNALAQVDEHDRQAIVHALLLHVINQEFDCFPDLLSAAHRLQVCVDVHVHESRMLSENKSVSESTTREIETHVLNRGLHCIVGQHVSMASPTKSPHSVA